jgi:hypothetical protein
MSANDRQINGDHYQASIQTWDYIVAHDLSFLEGNVIKYVTRFRKKNGLQDLEKARHYLDKLIEVEHDRLRRASNTDEQATKAVASEFARQSPINGGITVSDATDRKPPATALRGRDEGRDGTPTRLEDII